MYFGDTLIVAHGKFYTSYHHLEERIGFAMRKRCKKLVASVLAVAVMAQSASVLAFADEAPQIEELAEANISEETTVEQDSTLTLANALLEAGVMDTLLAEETPAEKQPSAFESAVEKTEGAIVSAAVAIFDADDTAIELGKNDMRGDYLIAGLLETIAVIDLDDAADAVEETEAELKDTVEAMESIVEDAEQAQQDAEDAQAEAEQAKQDAETAKDKAEEAKADAEAAQSAGQVVHDLFVGNNAAQKAEDAAEKAETAAADAQKAADEAAQKAAEAEQKYNEAVSSFEALKAEVEELLADGLISAEMAVESTAAAAEKANAYHEEMLDAYLAAQQATKDAEAARDEARQDLANAAEELEQAILDNAKDAAQDTAVVAATGAALLATKAAVAAADLTVNYYEARQDALQKQIDSLQGAIDYADAQIALAQAELDAMDDPESGEYAVAKANLDAAIEAKKQAENILANAEKILQDKADAAADTDLNAAWDAVKNDTATPEQVELLTDFIMKKLGEYGVEDVYSDIVLVDADTLLFSARKDGEDVLFKAEVAGETGSCVLQFYSAEEKKGANIADMSELGNPADPSYTFDKKGNANTSMQAKVGDKSFDIIANKKSNTFYVRDGGYDRELKWDSSKNTFYYTYFSLLAGTVRVDVDSIYDAEKPYLDVAEEESSITSGTLADEYWGIDSKDEAQQNVNDALTAMTEANQAFQQAKKDRDLVESVISGWEQSKDISTAEQDKLKDDYKKNDAALNGSQLDKTVRDLITGDADPKEVLSSGLHLAELLAKKANGTITPEEEEELAVLQVVKDIADGSLNADSIPAVAVSILQNSNISAKTKLVIAEKFESIAQDAYDKAKDDLQKTISDAEDELAEKSQAVTDAAADVARKEAAYQDARVKEATAAVREAEAAELKEQADAASTAAQEAYEAYQEMANTELDDSLVKEAEENYNAAQAAADAAQAAADAAALDAQAARKAADDARAAAEDIRNTLAKYTPTMAGSLMSELNRWAGTWHIQGMGEAVKVQIGENSMRFLDANDTILYEDSYSFVKDTMGVTLFQADSEGAGLYTCVALGARVGNPAARTIRSTIRVGEDAQSALDSVPSLMTRKADLLDSFFTGIN